MRKIIKEIQPDVIIPFVGTVLYVSWLAITGMKIPFVLTIRNNPWTMPEKMIVKKFSAITWLRNLVPFWFKMKSNRNISQPI